LRTRLVLLVLLATLPSLALLFLTASQQRDDALAAGQSETTRIARLVAADQRNVSAQVETVLGSLAITTELRGDDSGACQSRLHTLVAPEELTGRETGPDFRVSGASFELAYVINRDQNIFCRPPGQVGELSPEDADLAAMALERGRLVTGNLRSSTTGSLLATYAVPLAGDDQEGRRVLVAVAEIYALATFGVNANLPTDSFVVIFDRDGNLEQQFPQGSIPHETGAPLAATPIVGEAIGQIDPPEGEEFEFTINDQEFVHAVDDFWTPGPDGSTRLSYVMVAIPEDVVVERANQQFNENLGKLAIAGLIGIVAAWVGADLMGSRDTEARKAQIRDLFHAFQTGEVKDLDQIIGPGYVDRTAAPGQAEGLDGLRQNIVAFRTAFQGGRIVIRELLADHDKVVARVTLTGIHVADYVGVPPSGKAVLADGVETFRFLHGMVVESWSMYGELRPRNAAPDPVEAPAPERRGLLARLFRLRSRATPESPA
jgi:predicted ester cyclase